MASIDVLTSIPSFRSLTLIPETDELTYWWTEGAETTLRILQPGEETIETVPIEGFVPQGWEPVHWTGSEFIVTSRPELYLVGRDGRAEEYVLEEEYTHVHDVSPDGRYLFYTHYEEIHAETWPLRLYDRERDEKRTLTEHPQQSGHAGFSPDGTWVAFRENPEDRFHEGRHVVSHCDGARERTFHVADANYRCQQHSWHPDGQRLLVADRSSGFYRAGLYDWQTDEATWFGTGVCNERPRAVIEGWSQLLVSRRRGGVDVPVVYSEDGEFERELALPDGVLNAAIGYAANELLLHHESSTNPGRLLAYDLETDDWSVLVDTWSDTPGGTDGSDDANEQPGARTRDGFELVGSEHVTYESTDGTSVNAILYRAERTPAPAVVYIHGGPTSAERRDFDPFAQYLVNEGYTVLKPNYRGSTDQDRSFEEAIRGDVGGGEVDDVAAGGCWLADQSWIDADRIAALGHSHGGYNASMLAVRFSEPWGVVCIKNGYLAFSAEDANPYARRRMVADPERERSEAFKRERSAIERVDEIDCPVCLLYGDQDHLIEEAREFAELLEDHGWSEGTEYRFEVFEGEGHVIRDTERLWNVVAEVLDEYC